MCVMCVCCVFLVLSFLGGILYWTESLTTAGTHKGHSISPADTDRKKKKKKSIFPIQSSTKSHSVPPDNTKE